MTPGRPDEPRRFLALPTAQRCRDFPRHARTQAKVNKSSYRGHGEDRNPQAVGFRSEPSQHNRH